MRGCLFPHGLHQHWVLSMLPFSKYVGERDSPKLAFLVILRFFHFGIHLVNICIYSSVLWPFSIRFLTYQFEEFNYIQWILTIFCYKCPDIFCQLVNRPFDFKYPASCRMELHPPKPPSWHFSRPFHCTSHFWVVQMWYDQWIACHTLTPLLWGRCPHLTVSDAVLHGDLTRVHLTLHRPLGGDG